MKLRPDGARLVEVLRDPRVAQGYQDAQWSSLIATARSANVLGALAERLKDAGVGACVQAERHLSGARQLSMRQRQSVVWEVYQINEALGTLQIPVVLLKGAAYVLANHLVARGRLFGDIDILVPRDSLWDVESRLMLNGWISAKSSAYDQRYYRQWMHEIPPLTHLRRGTVLDVHHTILPLTSRNAPDPRQIIARSTIVPLSGLPALRVPCAEDLVIHSITHLVHEGELHNGLRDLRDIDCMLRSFGAAPAFWSRLAGFAAGNDLAQPVLLGLHLTRLIFATPIPDAIFEQLSADERATQPAQWLKATYIKALSPLNMDDQELLAGIARSLIYVRAHALRMPLSLLVRHLSVKAWMALREYSGDPDKVKATP